MTESLGLAWEGAFEGCVPEDEEGTETALERRVGLGKG